MPAKVEINPLLIDSAPNEGPTIYSLTILAGAGKRPAFMGVDQCKFRKPVRPGDVLTLEAEITKYRRGIGSVECKVLRDGVVVSQAVLMATMV